MSSSRRERIVGILAYGSLKDDPGVELGPLIIEKVEGVGTPFAVEFARASRTRDGAPTLVPISEGGATVAANILVLQAPTTEPEATDVLWRRETGREGSGKRYEPPPESDTNTVLIRCLENFGGLDVALYADTGANILGASPRKLAELAVRSASSDAGTGGRDGIAYLIEVKKNGVYTPLMPEYEKEILRLADTETLEQAREKLTKRKS